HCHVAGQASVRSARHDPDSGSSNRVQEYDWPYKTPRVSWVSYWTSNWVGLRLRRTTVATVAALVECSLLPISESLANVHTMSSPRRICAALLQPEWKSP